MTGSRATDLRSRPESAADAEGAGELETPRLSRPTQPVLASNGVGENQG
jgi:hypothetical protein